MLFGVNSRYLHRANAQTITKSIVCSIENESKTGWVINDERKMESRGLEWSKLAVSRLPRAPFLGLSFPNLEKIVASATIMPILLSRSLHALYI